MGEPTKSYRKITKRPKQMIKLRIYFNISPSLNITCVRTKDNYENWTWILNRFSIKFKLFYGVSNTLKWINENKLEI